MICQNNGNRAFSDNTAFGLLAFHPEIRRMPRPRSFIASSELLRSLPGPPDGQRISLALNSEPRQRGQSTGHTDSTRLPESAIDDNMPSSSSRTAPAAKPDRLLRRVSLPDRSPASADLLAANSRYWGEARRTRSEVAQNFPRRVAQHAPLVSRFFHNRHRSSPKNATSPLTASVSLADASRARTARSRTGRYAAPKARRTHAAAGEMRYRARHRSSPHRG
jgi:hypothetical protein